MEWITGRPPRDDELSIWGEALITTHGHLLEIATWDGSDWWVRGRQCCYGEVLAFMKLPEPYREEK